MVRVMSPSVNSQGAAAESSPSQGRSAASLVSAPSVVCSIVDKYNKITCSGKGGLRFLMLESPLTGHLHMAVRFKMLSSIILFLPLGAFQSHVVPASFNLETSKHSCMDRIICCGFVKNILVPLRESSAGSIQGSVYQVKLDGVCELSGDSRLLYPADLLVSVSARSPHVYRLIPILRWSLTEFVSASKLQNLPASKPQEFFSHKV